MSQVDTNGTGIVAEAEAAATGQEAFTSLSLRQKAQELFKILEQVKSITRDVRKAVFNVAFQQGETDTAVIAEEISADVVSLLTSVRDQVESIRQYPTNISFRIPDDVTDYNSKTMLESLIRGMEQVRGKSLTSYFRKRK